MATGYLHNPGGVMSGADVAGAGQDAWSRVAGVPPLSVLVGGPGHPDDPISPAYNVSRLANRIVTQDATPGPLTGPGIELLDDWRDTLNFRGSPVPWLLLMTLGIVGLMQFRLMVRAGGKRGPKAEVGLG